MITHKERLFTYLLANFLFLSLSLVFFFGVGYPLRHLWIVGACLFGLNGILYFTWREFANGETKHQT